MNTLIIFSAKYLYLFAVLYALVLWLRLKEKRKDIFMLGVISLPLTYLVARLAGYLYFNPRPFVVGHFIPLISHSIDNGFPSDHALFVSALAMLFFYYRRNASVLLWGFAFVVGATRVMAGVHHWLDIIGSMVIAFCIAWVSNAYLLPLVKRTRLYQRV